MAVSSWGVTLTTHIPSTEFNESAELFLYSHLRLRGLFWCDIYLDSMKINTHKILKYQCHWEETYLCVALIKKITASEEQQRLEPVPCVLRSGTVMSNKKVVYGRIFWAI